ncbi:MAG: heme ABC exporter ATP-binding protein CcmA [Actinomycetota bacterium]
MEQETQRPAVAVHQAVVLLDRFPALAELDLELPAGSVTLIQGPNGAGKTTLLRLLAGLARLESGSASVLGYDVVTQRRQVRASVGLLAPNAMLYEDLTITENLTFWSTLAGTGDAAIEAALDRVGLAGLAAQHVSTLSTGQRRRATLAAVAVRRPRLWLLDEPHAGLDQAGRNIVDAFVSDAVDAGATVVVASHELDRVRPLATHVVTVAGGAVRRCERVAAAPSRGEDQPRA